MSDPYLLVLREGVDAEADRRAAPKRMLLHGTEGIGYLSGGLRHVAPCEPGRPGRVDANGAIPA